MSSRRGTLLALVVLAICVPPQPAGACSEAPWMPPDFVLTTGPEDLDAFAAGDLGIVLPDYARSYLIVAYRAMIGKPLTEVERQGAMRVWRKRLGRGPWVEREGLDAWLAVRSGVCGSAGWTDSVRTVMIEDPEVNSLRFMSFHNCYPDAFETAASRLEELITRHGAESPQTLDWLTAQDAVFRNCSERVLAVPPPASNRSPEEHSDRDYQLASAWFYSDNFDLAEAAFRAIARDQASRWHTLAPYLVVRCLVRRAEMDWKARDAYLSQALLEVDMFLQDPAAAELHAAASRMRGIIVRRLDPDRRTPELAELIASGQRPDEFAENLWDLTGLLDLYSSSPGRPWQNAFLRQDLIAWLRAFQGSGTVSSEAVVGTRSVPWLVAALAHAHGEDASASELLAAAGRLDPSSPAWLTVEYHRLRLLVEQSQTKAARMGLDAALGSARFGESASSKNLLMELRARVALDRRDFLKFAVRSPVQAWSGTYSQLGTQARVDARRLADTEIVESLLPLAEQQPLASDTDLDEATRERLAVAVWVRAVLLRRLHVARDVTPVLQAVASRGYHRERVEGALQAFLAARTERERVREAAFILLNLPGLIPFIEPRVRGADELSHGWDSNWWERGWPETWVDAWDTTTRLWRRPVLGPAADSYPSAESRAVAERERRQLASRGSPVSMLAREILTWAAEAPDEPRIPGMLRDVIVAGRYTSGDEQSETLLKRAFKLLHGRYRDTPEAAQTPYWYTPPQIIPIGLD